MRADRHTDKQTGKQTNKYADHNTSHPYQGKSTNTKIHVCSITVIQ